MNWQLARLPQILFGEGVSQQLTSLITGYGQRVLLITGGQSFDAQPQSQSLLASW